jgi:hypothetical protein
VEAVDKDEQPASIWGIIALSLSGVSQIPYLISPSFFPSPPSPLSLSPSARPVALALFAITRSRNRLFV